MLAFNNRVVWIPVKNTTGETIPGGALMKVVSPGQDADGNWLVAKPDKDSDSNVIVNGEAEIPAGQVGSGHRDSMAVLVYDTADSLPLAGDSYGSKSGSWYANKDKTGFIIDSAGNGRANASRTISKASEVTVLYIGGPSVSSFTVTIPANTSIKGVAVAEINATSPTAFSAVSVALTVKMTGGVNNVPGNIGNKQFGTYVGITATSAIFLAHAATSCVSYDYTNNTASSLSMIFEMDTGGYPYSFFMGSIHGIQYFY